MIDVQEVRRDFSIYKNQPNLVYLDSAATSLTPDCVVDSMSSYYKEYRATVHRTAYTNGERADENYNSTRAKVANFINANIEEVVFTRGTTAGLNILARCILDGLQPGDEIISSELEHHSNLLPWREIRKDIIFKYVELNNMSITLENIKKCVTNKTKVISINHVSNIIGQTVDIKSIGNYCKDNNILFVVDGAQAISHEYVDVKDLCCDFYLFSAHKLFGPTGLGILYGRQELLKKMNFDYGGDMAAIVSINGFTSNSIPIGLEAGTPSIAEVIGFGPAIDYVLNVGIDNINNHVVELKKYAIREINKIEGITVYNSEVEGSTIAFNIDGFSVHDALAIYSKNGICLRGGHMCNYLT
ncbi:MAG: aminotransferase class V-fold PLP-dependent enzyme, partial [Mycoplasmatales bacterium]